MLDIGERYVLAGNVPIKKRLIPHITALNDYVVDHSRKAWVTKERQDEVVDIFLTMRCWHRYDFKRVESFQDCRDRRFGDRVLSVADRMAGWDLSTARS